MSSTANLAATKLETGQAQKEPTINEALDILDAAISGVQNITTTGGTTTLTGTAAAPQAQHMLYNVTGALGSNATIEVPVAAGTGRNRVFIVKNGTTGAFTLTVKVVGGTGVKVAQGSIAILAYDGSDIVHAQGGTWASWTPTWTNLSVGNGTVTAKFTQIGKTVFCRLTIVFGSTTSISGAVSLTLPVTSASYAGSAANVPLGSAVLLDSGTNNFQGNVVWTSTTQARVSSLGVSGSNINFAPLSSTVPHTWAVNDEINLQFSYEAA